jgi:gliding motility-associated-like protein
MNKNINRLTIKKVVLGIVFLLSIVSSNVVAQTCVTSSRNSWEWPGHNNWFLATGGTGGISYMLDQKNQSVTSVIQTDPCYNCAWDAATTKIRAYQGVATASNDKGELVFFTNGRKAWDAAGKLITDKILSGNECGSTEDMQSAVHGVMTMRHPLTPDKYYIISIDDIVSQGSPNVNNQEGTCGNGITFAVIDSSGGLGHASIPIENNVSSGNLGAFRTTEDFAATLHANGVDIWITFHPLWQTHVVSYLLTCDGFVTPPVVSGNGDVPYVSIFEGNGGLDFSPDGSKLALGAEINLSGSNVDSKGGTGSVNLYDFDNKTGEITNRKAIYHKSNGTQNFYNLFFSASGNELHYGGSGGGGKYDVSSNDEAMILAVGSQTSSTFSSGDKFAGGAMTYQGVLETSHQTFAKYSETSSNTRWSSNNIYIPPLEEPDIQEVGPFCDTVQIVDLHTYWLCSGVSAEDTLYQRHLYKGDGIVDDKLGHFNPAVAGPGTHEIIFTYCGVDDTTYIEVVFCPSCKIDVKEEHPIICIGETVRLDTMINIANGDRFWTIDSFPTTAAQKAEITFTGDTVFDATNLGTHYGTYKLMLANVFEGDSCFDSIYVTVNPLPEPDLGNDSTICFDWDDVTFDAGPFVSFDWGTDGGDVQTITKSEAKLYKVEVTDLNGCKQKDSVELFINELPKADLGDSLEICEGDDAVIFDASTASIGGEGSAITKYTWEDGSDGATKTTDVDGTYWVAIEDANMCHDTDTVVLTVHALPEVELRSDTSICAGDAAIEFIAFAGLATDTTYTWDSGEIGEMISKDAAGIYKVVMEDQFGCLDSDEVELTINALPVIELRDSTICGDADPVLWDAAVATPGMTTYIWSDTDVAGDGKLETKIDGIYWIIIEDANQCSDTDTVVLTVNNFVPVEIGPDTSICEDADDVLFDAGIEGAQSYIWALEDFTPVGSAQTFTTGVDGKYYLALIDSNGCQGADSIILTVNLLPKVDLGPDTAICKEDPKVVFDAKNAGVGMTYSWSTNEASQTIENDVAGEYWVAIKDVKGCTDSDTIVLTVHDLPVVDLGDDVEICAIEDSVLFNAGHSTAQSWVWDHGRTTQTIKAKNEGTETYRVVVTDENGCIGEDEVDLTVSPMPEVTIRDSSVCIDADDVLFDVGADFDQYLWSNGDATRTSTISAAGDYSVTFTTLEGCEGTADFKLERTALPTPDLGADQIICADASALDFTPGVFASYLWNDGKTTPTLSTKVAGDYEVEVTDDKGCKASDDVKLTVIDMPTPDIIKDETKCPGSPHTFDVVGYDNGNGPYTYAWQDGSTASTFPTAIATTVWVDITDQYGCTGRDLGSVIDKSDLTVNILDNLTVNLCEGEDVTLIPNFKASDGYFFTWSADGSGTSETFLATATGTYDLHVDNGGGCKGDGTIDVIVHLDPVLAPDAAGICDGEAALIGGMNNLGGTYTYLWNTGETSATISVLTAGIYTQEVTSDQECVSEETVDVDVYSNPTPSIQGTTVCQGVPVTLTDLNDKGETTDFIWSTGATTATISPTTTGSFTLDVIDIHGCEGTSTTAVTFIAYPTVDLGKDMVICEGDDKVTFDAGNIGNTITWNSGQTTSTISTDQAGEYIVTVSDGGCPAYDTVVLSVVDLPVSELNQLLGVAPYCFNELETAILLEAGARNDYEYLWGTGETTPSITVDAPGTYLVEISAGSCFITDRITLMDYCPSTLYVPNTFTPDNDGLNDYFLAVGDYIANFEMYVYNRWGQLIFHSDNIYEGWDGTYSGNEVQIDTYVYKIYYDVNQPDLPPASLQKVGIVNVLK